MKVVISAGGRGKELPIHHLLKLIVRLGGMPVIVHVIKGFVSQETYAICSRGWLPQNGPGRYFEGQDTEAGASAELIESRGIHESALLIHIWTPPWARRFCRDARSLPSDVRPHMWLLRQQLFCRCLSSLSRRASPGNLTFRGIPIPHSGPERFEGTPPVCVKTALATDDLPPIFWAIGSWKILV